MLLGGSALVKGFEINPFLSFVPLDANSDPPRLFISPKADAGALLGVSFSADGGGNVDVVAFGAKSTFSAGFAVAVAVLWEEKGFGATFDMGGYDDLLLEPELSLVDFSENGVGAFVDIGGNAAAGGFWRTGCFFGTCGGTVGAAPKEEEALYFVLAVAFFRLSLRFKSRFARTFSGVVPMASKADREAAEIETSFSSFGTASDKFFTRFRSTLEGSSHPALGFVDEPGENKEPFWNESLTTGLTFSLGLSSKLGPRLRRTASFFGFVGVLVPVRRASPPIFTVFAGWLPAASRANSVCRHLSSSFEFASPFETGPFLLVCADA